MNTTTSPPPKSVQPVIRARERDAVLNTLRSGVVPRVGQHLIQVGRVREIETLLADIHRIADGGSAIRFVIGEYGAGKSFFLQLVSAMAMEKKLVVATADLNPSRRIHSNGGHAKSLYAELMRNLSTRSKPDGGALSGVVEKFITTAMQEAKAAGLPTEQVLRRRLEQLTELTNGYDFADVVAAYCRGFEEGNEQLKVDAVRWLRGEFSSRVDARKALGVRAIVDDATIYDQLKLMARFVRLAGYAGLLIGLDEMVNLYKLSNAQARSGNYEQLLRMINDSHQGHAVGLGFLLGGTPEFLMDPRRGLYSYPALQSRLAENTFAKDGLVDFTGPVIRLSSLTLEEFYVLLEKIRHIHAMGDTSKYLLPDDALVAFMNHCAKKLGNDFFRTPRTTITAFINMLAVLEQNAGASWQDLLGQVEPERDTGGSQDLQVEVQDDDEFATFKI